MQTDKLRPILAIALLAVPAVATGAAAIPRIEQEYGYARDLFGTFLSDADTAWRKGGCGVYVFRKPFPPTSRMAEVGGARRSSHPTQKPIGLMGWSIERSGAPEGAVILDPFMGLGTTLVAAKNLGRKSIGIEIEERYCEIAAERLSQGILDLRRDA